MEIERGGIIYRAGREQQPERGRREGGTRTTNFLKSTENFVLFFLVDAELPGMNLCSFFRKRGLNQRIIQPNFQAEDFTISIQTSHYLIPQ